MRDVESAERVGRVIGVSGVGSTQYGEHPWRRRSDVGADSPLVARSWLLLVAWAFLVQLLAVRAFAGGLLPSPPSVFISPCRIDVNRAGVAELQALPSLGPSRAEAVVLERIRHGPFEGLADLSRVRGIGPETLICLGEFVHFGPEYGY